MSPRGKLLVELAAVEATIAAAYWAFTRQKRAKPPVLVCPEAYRRRTEIQAELRKLRPQGVLARRWWSAWTPWWRGQQKLVDRGLPRL